MKGGAKTSKATSRLYPVGSLRFSVREATVASGSEYLKSGYRIGDLLAAIMSGQKRCVVAAQKPETGLGRILRNIGLVALDVPLYSIYGYNTESK